MKSILERRRRGSGLELFVSERGGVQWAIVVNAIA